MSVYVVTKEDRIVRYDPPHGRRIWIAYNRQAGRHLIYSCNCSCSNDQVKKKVGHSNDHEAWIAWIDEAKIVSIGFEQPTIVPVVHGLTPADWGSLVKLSAWLERAKLKGRIPKKLNIEPLCHIVGGRETS